MSALNGVGAVILTSKKGFDGGMNMNVLDILLEAADMLGMKEEIRAFFSGDDDGYERQANQLLTCFHLAECALALDYIPLYAEDELMTATGRLEFSEFSHAPVRIVEVKDRLDNVVPYTLYPKYLKADAGYVKVTYAYTPLMKSVEDESDFAMLTSPHVLVYGTLLQYCLANGLLQEAAIWDKKWKDSVEYLCHTKKCKRLGSRTWL